MPRDDSILDLVIPVFNQWDFTRACLESLAASGLPEAARVIVCDNASSDATPSQALSLGRSLFSTNFTYLRSESNLGFAKACNLGAAESRADYLLFLNNDTLVFPGWLPPLLELARRADDFGALSPLLLYPGGESVQHLGITFGPDLSPEHLFEHFPAGHPAVRGRQGLQAVSGAALMLPRRTFELCGGFYPEYVNGFEDLELCCRIREQGLKLLVCAQSRIWHYVGQTPGRFTHDAQNSRLLSQRCPACFVPDQHVFAAEFGYEPALTPWLESYLRPNPAKLAEIEEKFGKLANSDELLQALLGEPLWLAGRVKLCQLLEKSKRYSEALAQGLLLAHFFPELENLRLLARLARQAGDPLTLGQAAGKIERVLSELAEPQVLSAKAQNLASGLKAQGLPELASLYQRLV